MPRNPGTLLRKPRSGHRHLWREGNSALRDTGSEQGAAVAMGPESGVAEEIQQLWQAARCPATIKPLRPLVWECCAKAGC